MSWWRIFRPSGSTWGTEPSSYDDRTPATSARPGYPSPVRRDGRADECAALEKPWGLWPPWVRIPLPPPFLTCRHTGLRVFRHFVRGGLVRHSLGVFTTIHILIPKFKARKI